MGRSSPSGKIIAAGLSAVVLAILFTTVLLPSFTNSTPPGPGLPGVDRQEQIKLVQTLQDAYALQQNGEYDKAIAAFAEISAANPELVDVREAEFQLGQTFALNRDYTNTVTILQSFYDRYPEDTRHDQSGFRLGLAYREVKKWDNATTLLTEFAEKNPEIEPYIRYQLGVIYRKAGNLPRAIEEFGKAVTGIGPRLFEVAAMDEAAAACVELKDYANALTWYDKIRPRATFDSYKAELNYRSGLARKALGETAAAKALFLSNVTNYTATYYASLSLDELDHLDPTAVSPYLAGLVNHLNGRSDKALNSFNQVTSASPNAADALYYQGMIYQKQGNQTKAIARFDQIIKGFPQSSRVGAAWFQKGQSQSSDEEYADAIATFRQFATMFPRDTLAQDARWEAAQLMESLHQPADARQEYATLQRDYPAGKYAEDAAFRLGLMFYEEKRYNEAIQCWEDALNVVVTATQKAKLAYWAGKAGQLAGRTEASTKYLQQTIQTTPDEFYGFRAAEAAQGITVTMSSDKIRQSLSAPDNDQDRKDFVDWLGTWTSPAPPIGILTAISTTVQEDPAFKRGDALLAMGLKEDAVIEFQDVADRFSTDPVCGVQLSLYFRDKGLYQLSINAAGKLAKLSGERNYFNLPRLLLKLLYPPYYSDLALSEAEKNKLDPLLLLALIKQESLFEKDAGSTAEARGLTQVIPSTGQWIAQKLGVAKFANEDLFKPYVSIRFGAYYLGGLVDQFNGKVFFALAGYNGGPGNVSRWSNEDPARDADLFFESIDYSETKRYVQIVSENYAMYKYIYH